MSASDRAKMRELVDGAERSENSIRALQSQIRSLDLDDLK